MTALFDVTDDYAILDGNAAGEYFVATPPVSNADASAWSYDDAGSIGDLNVGEIQQTEAAASMGVYGRFDARIRLPSSEVNTLGVIPKIGDRIVAGGHTWTILHVGLPRFGDQWRLECRDLELAAGMTDHVDIRIPDSRPTDAAASDLVDYTTLLTNQAARIQTINGAPTDMHGGTLRGFTKHYVIYLAIDLDLPYGTLVVDSETGTVYEMVGFASRQSITDLSQIVAVVKPGA